jgi:hypothetical protein
MSITISDVAPWVQCVAYAGQTRFDLPFAFYSDSDLQVYSRTSAESVDDASQILVLDTDYTVTGAGNASGAYITLTTASTVDDVVTIVRNLPEARNNLYVPGGGTTATALNDDFTKDIMMIQQAMYIANNQSPRYANSLELSAGDLLLEKLPALYSWRMNAAGTKIESFLADSGGSTPVLGDMTVDINQVAHGLSVGNVVRCSGSNAYSKSQADSAANAEVCGYVSVRTDADNFTMVLGGLITTGLVGLTAGDIMYLDPTTAGALTDTKPTTPGQVVIPILQVTTSTTGIWLNKIGVIL